MVEGMGCRADGEQFFKEYRGLFESAESKVSGVADDRDKRLFTHKLFNFLLFERFIECRGWITFKGRRDALRALWEEYEEKRTSGSNFYAECLRVHFSPAGSGSTGMSEIHGYDIPRLDGWLIDLCGEYVEGHMPDEAIEPLLKDLLYSYSFVTTESDGDDTDVAVDPEMLGRVFEVLVASRHGSGSYYTPKPVVSFMCREALRGYLLVSLPGISEQVADRFNRWA